MGDSATLREAGGADSPPRGSWVEPDLGSHLPALDGLRGLAILGVMLCHMTCIGNRRNAVDHIVGVIGYSGQIGVDLFFVLSGFLITGILYESKGGASYFRNFYARRTLRIFPLYYAMVLIALIIVPHVRHAHMTSVGRIKGSEIWYWLYLSNYSIAHAGMWRHPMLDVSWSLAIEEQFYLVWPAVVFVCSRKTLIGVCVGLIVAALGARLYVTSVTTSWIPPYVLTPCRMDALGAGALVALLARGPRGARALVKPAWAVATAGAVAVAALMMTNPLGTQSPAWARFGYSGTAFLFAGCLLLAITRPAAGMTGRALGAGLFPVFGRYSYALYLFHIPLRALIRDRFYGPDGGRFGAFLSLGGSLLPGQLIFYVVSTGVVLAFAWLSWNLFEKQFLKLKRFFPSGMKSRQPTAVHDNVARIPMEPADAPADIETAAS